MSKLSQKEAVFKAVVEVTGHTGEGVTILFEGFRSGTIELDREFTDQELKSYVSGLQSNWLRKDKRLNGGIAYVAKNPGSRAGSGDPQLKAMRGLLASLTDPTERAEVQRYIDQRVAELSKAKQPEIDVNSLPAELAHLATKSS